MGSHGTRRSSHGIPYKSFASHLEICGTNFFVSRIPFVPSRKFSNSPESRLSRPEFFRIVPIPFVPSQKNFGTVPFVPRDGTNGIFRDSGLSCRTLFGTLVFLYCPESRLSRSRLSRPEKISGLSRLSRGTGQ